MTLAVRNLLTEVDYCRVLDVQYWEFELRRR